MLKNVFHLTALLLIIVAFANAAQRDKQEDELSAHKAEIEKSKLAMEKRKKIGEEAKLKAEMEMKKSMEKEAKMRAEMDKLAAQHAERHKQELKQSMKRAAQEAARQAQQASIRADL